MLDHWKCGLGNRRRGLVFGRGGLGIGSWSGILASAFEELDVDKILKRLGDEQT